jgi:CRISPR-associated protein Cmr1
MTVTLEAVTPVLLGGADNKTPELRPPPFRGAMRYWLRTALGSVIGDTNQKALRQLESAVFGSPDVGSPISIRLASENIVTQKAFILPHQKKGRRDGLVSNFELVITQPRSSDSAVWDAAISSLLLALTFGGVGLRSRRGYGTLRVVETSGDGIPVFPTSFYGWKRHVNQAASTAIEAAKKLAQAQGVTLASLPSGPASYPCATKSGLIRLCDIQASSAMGAVIHFMSHVPKKNWLGGISPRQASPLWVRPIQTAKSYGLLCTVLASDFPGANYTALKQFLDKFPGEYLQVKGWNT